MIRGDHFNVSVTSNVREHLKAAIAIAWADSKPATHYKVEPLPESWDEKRLTAPALMLSYEFGEYIAKAEAKGWKPLPFPLNAAKAATFAWDWLESADRGQRPDIDGTVRPDAFTVRTSRGWDGYIVAIVPTCSVYGK